MKVSQLGKTGRALLAITLILGITLIIVGTSISSSNSEWVVFAGVALFLLAGLPAVEVLTGRSQSDDQIGERRIAGRKISTNLVALSSAAILAVYAAGYDRTSSAADRFAAQTASPRRPSPAAIIAARNAAARALEAAPTVSPSQTSEAVTNQPADTVSPLPSSAATAPASGDAPEPVSAPAETTLPPAPAPEAVAIPGDAVAATNDQAKTALGPAPTVAAAAVPEAQYRFKDGAYWGRGTCRHGDIEVQVVIEAGRIYSAAITKCQTLYPCSMIKTAPPQVVSRQDPTLIDNVSGATDSVDAYYDAVAAALNVALQ